jgi:hypothetical protein
MRSAFTSVNTIHLLLKNHPSIIMFRWMVYILINLIEQTERLNAIFFCIFTIQK